MNPRQQTEACLSLTANFLEGIQAHLCVIDLGMDHDDLAACSVDAEEIARLGPPVVANHDIKGVEKIGQSGVDGPDSIASAGVRPAATGVIEMSVNAAEYAFVHPVVETRRSATLLGGHLGKPGRSYDGLQGAAGLITCDHIDGQRRAIEKLLRIDQ